MHETTFARIRLPLCTVGVPCLRITVTPVPAANTPITMPVAQEGQACRADAGPRPDAPAGRPRIDIPGEP